MNVQPPVKIRVLGSIEVVVDGELTKIGGRRVSALLGWIAALDSKSAKKDDIANAFWPNSDLQTRRRNLRQLIFLARKALSPYGDSALLTNEEQVWLSDQVTSDLDELQAQSNSDVSSQRLEAQQLYRGYLLSDLEDSDWLSKRLEVHDFWTEMSYDLIEQFEREGSITEAIAVARSLARLDPLDERARFALVSLLAIQSPVAARQEYSDLERQLAKELGSSPSIPLSRLIAINEGGSTTTSYSNVRPREPEKWELKTNPIHSATRKNTNRMRAFWAVLLLVFVCVLTIQRLQREPPVPDALVASLKSDSGPIDSKLAKDAETFSELAWVDAYGPKEEAWRIRIAPLEDRLTSIMKWTVTNEPSRAVRIGGALERYFLLINRQKEWAALLKSALEKAPKEESLTYARAETALVIANPTGGFEANLERIRHAQRICEDREDAFLKVQTIRAEGFLNGALEHHAEARDLYEKALVLARQLGEDRQIALCLFCLGIMGPDPRIQPADDFSRRIRATIEAFDRFSSLSNVWGIRASASLLAGNLPRFVASGSSSSLAQEGMQRLISAADLERRFGNPPVRLANLLNAAKIAILVQDSKTACDLLYQVSVGDAGGGLGFQERHRLKLACYKVDSVYAKQLFREMRTDDSLPSQSSLEILESVLK